MSFFFLTWYYLGSFQTSRVELFSKIVFDYKWLTFFCKKHQLRWLGYTEYHQKILITSLMNRLSIFFPVSFFPLLLSSSWRKFEPQTKVEHKFANIQTQFVVLSTLVLRDYSKWRESKSEHGEGDNAHPNFCSKSNNERNILTHHEIIDCITEKVKSVITQVCKESKLWIHPNLRWPSFSLTFN